MNLVAIIKESPWMYLAIINGLLHSVLSRYFAKNKLQTLLDICTSVLVLTLILIKSLIVEDYIWAILPLAMILLTIRDNYKKKLFASANEDISWQPIFMTSLFICSYILGVAAQYLEMPWYAGYLFPIFCFILGLIIYKKTKPA